MDQLTILSLSVELHSRRLSPMQVLNNNLRNSQTLKSLSLKSNLNSNQKRKMHKLELAILMISRVLSMLNGKSSMKNYRRFMMLVLRLFCLNCPLEILLLSGSLIEVFSALEELPMKILTELPSQLVPSFKRLLITLLPMCLEPAEDSKKNKLELNVTIFLRIAQMYKYFEYRLNLLPLSCVEELSNSLNKPKDH